MGRRDAWAALALLTANFSLAPALARSPADAERIGDYRAAEPARRAELRQAARSHPHSAVHAEAVHALAENLYAQGKYDEAEELYRQALSLRLAVLPPSSPLLLQSTLELASLMADNGKLAQALALAEASEEKIWAGDQPQRLKTAGILANLLESDGQWERAERIWQRLLDGQREDGFDKAVVLNNLGVNRFIQATGAVRVGTRRPISGARSMSPVAYGQWTGAVIWQARRNFAQALQIMEKVSAPDSPDIANSYASLGAAALAMGDQASAYQALQKAYAIRAKRLPPDHPDRIVGTANLALAQEPSGEAHALMSEAMARATARLATSTGAGPRALGELRRYRPVFIAGVRFDWELASR